MKLSKTRMIYLAVLVVAIGFLIWDRSNQKGRPRAAKPRDTRSAPHRSTTPSSTTPSSTAPAPSQYTAPPSEIAMDAWMLKQLNPTSAAATQLTQNNVRDLFQRSSKMKQALNQHQHQPEVSQFLNRIIITSILIQPQHSCALINNEIYQLGDFIGPLKITDIQPDHITLKYQQNDYTVYIDSIDYQP